MHRGINADELKALESMANCTHWAGETFGQLSHSFCKIQPSEDFLIIPCGQSEWWPVIEWHKALYELYALWPFSHHCHFCCLQGCWISESHHRHVDLLKKPLKGLRGGHAAEWKLLQSGECFTHTHTHTPWLSFCPSVKWVCLSHWLPVYCACKDSESPALAWARAEENNPAVFLHKQKSVFGSRSRSLFIAALKHFNATKRPGTGDCVWHFDFLLRSSCDGRSEQVGCFPSPSKAFQITALCCSGNFPDSQESLDMGFCNYGFFCNFTHPQIWEF